MVDEFVVSAVDFGSLHSDGLIEALLAFARPAGFVIHGSPVHLFRIVRKCCSENRSAAYGGHVLREGHSTNLHSGVSYLHTRNTHGHIVQHNPEELRRPKIWLPMLQITNS